jgi:hypothetical protein
MRVLLPKYWTKFNKQKNDGGISFNGVLFEELVRLILSIHFEGNWKPTSMTWDGGKDFVDRSIEGEESWVECKMYKTNLSIKAVSNTLVMAINKKNAVRRLLLFSYSPLNKNARSHLARFSDSTNIIVQVFDDDKLEDLILNSKQIKSRFFPRAIDLILPVSEKDEVSIHPFFSTDIHIESSQLRMVEGVEKSRKPFVPIHTPCLYEIVIRSHSILNSLNVGIDLSKIYKEDTLIDFLNKSEFRCDDKELFNYVLRPSQLTSFKLYLAPLSINLKEIPQLNIYLPNSNVKKVPSIPIRVPRLNHPSLVSTYIYKALDDFEFRISTKNIITQTIISGKSGVGKTRFMDEAEIKLLTQNYSVFKLDGRDSKSDDFFGFVSNLLTLIWRLPNIHLLLGEDENVIESSDGNTLFDQVCSFIIEAESRTENLTDKIDELLDLVTKGLLNQRAALLIDNVQKLDRLTIQFIEQLSFRLVGTIGQITLLFTFNEEELIYSTEASVLHNKLKKNSIEPKAPSQFIEIPEFDKKTVEAFLNTICGNIDNKQYFTKHYPRLTKFIHLSVLPRPLDLYQLFLAAQDEQADIARVEDGFFFIKDSEKFLRLIQSVNKKTATILDERLQNLKFKQKLIRVLITLAYLGKCDIGFLQLVTKTNHDDFDYLIEGGWLRYGTANNIDFYHPSIERFVLTSIINSTNQKNLRFLNDISLDCVINYLSESRYKDEYSLTLFVISNNKESLFLNAIKHVKMYNDSVPTIRKKIFTDALYVYILQNRKIDPEVYIDSIHLICNYSSEGELKEFVNRLDIQRSNLKTYVPKTNNSANALCKIMREYASYLNLFGNPKEGDLILIEEINRLESLPESIDQEVINRIKVNYLNRRCVCLKSMNLFDDAEKIGLIALDLADKYGFLEFVCLTLIDLSVIFRNEKTNFKQYSYYLEKALSFYEKYSNEIDNLDSSIEFACLENAAHLQGLRGDIDVSIASAELLIKKVKKQYSHYYLLRGLTAKAVMMARDELSQEIPENYKIEQILELSKEIEDISIVSIFNHFYVKSLHLQAILYSFLGNLNRAMAFYSSALEILEDKFRESQGAISVSPSEKALIWDAVNFWNSNNIKKIFPLDEKLFFVQEPNLTIKMHIENKIIKEPSLMFAKDDFNYPFP